MKTIVLAALVSLCGALSAAVPTNTAVAAERLKVVIKDHKFSPDRLTAPRGEAFEIEVVNEGPGAEEFESAGMRLEKIIPEGKSAVLRVAPLKSGTYDMFGEFHLTTCTGTVVVP